jgi:diamine N-acetyltransferase
MMHPWCEIRLPQQHVHNDRCALKSIIQTSLLCHPVICLAPHSSSTTAPQSPCPSRDSILTYREVTEDNWRAVANLNLKDGQKGNLAANVWSLAEAAYSEDAWVRAIYADDTLFGMLMLAIWDPDEAYYIWRFMIDGRYQNLGFGRRGIEHAIAHIRQHNPHAKQLGVMSTPPEGKKSDNPDKLVTPEESPFKFYEKLGFRQTDPPDEDGEVMMKIDLQLPTLQALSHSMDITSSRRMRLSPPSWVEGTS